MDMRGHAEDLARRRARATRMGGDEAVGRQHAAGKLERIERLFDEATFSPYIAAGAALIDAVIDPRDTRPVLICALEMARGKRVDRPWRKHGVMPV